MIYDSFSEPLKGKSMIEVLLTARKAKVLTTTLSGITWSRFQQVSHKNQFQLPFTTPDQKTFQAAQLTHEIFLTVDHSYKISFCQNELPECWCVVLYYTTHQRSVEVQFGSYQKIFCRSDLWSKFSHVLVVQLELFYP